VDGIEPLEPRALAQSIPLSEERRDELLIDMHGRVSRIEGYLEARADHEPRIQSLERKAYAFPGVSVLIAILAFFGVHPHQL